MLSLATMGSQFSRLVALVLATLLFATQLHLCEPTYTLPTGEKCSACPGIASLSQSRTNQLVTKTGDCRDCCKLTGCHDNTKTAVVAVTAPQVVPAILHCQTELVLCLLIVDAPVSVPRIEGIPPTGPPSPDNSRAPPDSTLV